MVFHPFSWTYNMKKYLKIVVSNCKHFDVAFVAASLLDQINQLNYYKPNTSLYVICLSYYIIGHAIML